MTETQRRIRAYKRALPELRERVIAVALLLAMSASMLGSASFAWITLSTAPEATGMATTVAANGNLEIALAQGSTQEAAVAPAESAVGDSSANQGIVKSNVTWGNLVNVSDPIYGLSNIALRPALLSDYNRTEYPLNGASYGGDGRVVSTYDRYEYASYTKVENSDTYYFAAGDKVNYGVRAISSVGYSNVTGNAMVDNYRNTTTQYYQDAQGKYGRIVSDGDDAYILDEASGVTCITALEGLVTVFAQDKINQMGYGPSGATKTSCSPYLWYVYQMMLLLEQVLVDEGNALLTMANWQAYVASGDAATTTTFASVDDLLAASGATLEEKGVTLTTLADYENSLTVLRKCIEDLYPMAKDCENPEAPLKDYYWEDISSIVNKLVDINSTTINGKRLDSISGMGDAMDVLGGGPVIIYKGVLKDIEQRSISNDKRVQADVAVKVKTSIIGSPTVNGTVYTAAYGTEPTYSTDIQYSDGLQSSAKGDATAKDTYGLALDVWVRTNYPDAVLTLEGSVKYEDQDATIEVDGTSYNLYTITISETEVDVYSKTGEDGTVTWYYANGHSEVPEEDMGEQTPKQKKIQVIIGYEGENRIWEDWEDLLDAGYIEKDATTQGAGSCFVFYADTPAEQAKIMEMLEAFNVAFMNQNGDILGTARLNIDSAYANQGKVTVPLEVVTGTNYTDDENGEDRVGITTLVQNEPLLVTAIVYLNGTQLKNENVLADGELQGQLNIQFGTNSTLVAPDNEELQAQARTITAKVAVTKTNGSVEEITDGVIGGTEGLEYNAAGYPTKVTLSIEGEQPEKISGFFVRVINATQGTRGEEVSFTKQEDGTWTADFTLTNPGTYVFNTLLVDGVQYTLHDGTVEKSQGEYYPANRPKVYIQGLKLNSVTVDPGPGTYMTADTSKTFTVTANIDAAVEPRQVNAQFFSADNSKQYTAILTRIGDSNNWTGTANINSSGTYTLKYVSVDGQILDVPAQGSYTLYLGLTARISTTVPEADRTYIFTGAKQLTMRARIFDDTGTAMENLSGVKLTYNNIKSPAELEWQADGYYEGVLDATNPGFLTFRKLDIGNAGTITSVSNAPSFTAISLALPTYVSGSAPSKQTIIGSGLNATMTVNLKNAETANVWAELTKTVGTTTETRVIQGEHGTGDDSAAANVITFTLPKEDGDWTLNRLFLQNVYDKDANNGAGQWYGTTAETPTADTSYILMPTDTVTTDVVATPNIDLYYGQDENGDPVLKTENFTVAFGGSDAAFMTNYTNDPLLVEVKDYKSRPIDGLSKVTWTITHNANTMKDYGGYTGEGQSQNTVTLTLKSGSETVYEAAAQNFYVAGVYNSAITVDLGTNGTKTPSAVPTFTVTSKAPTVTITDITPDGTYSADTNTSGTVTDKYSSTSRVENGTDGCGNQTTTTYYTHTWKTDSAHKSGHTSTISADGLTANLYFKCEHADDATYSGGSNTTDSSASNQRYHNYMSDSGYGNPSVTLTLNGITGFDSATLNFSNSTHIYDTVTYTPSGFNGTWETTGSGASFSWTSSGVGVTKYVGYSWAQKERIGDTINATGKKTPAGTITADTLTAVYGDVTYTINIDKITINNPY